MIRVRRYVPRRPVYRRAARSTTGRIRALNRRTKKGPPKVGPVRQQLSVLRKALKDLQPEVKYLDTSLDQTNITTSGTVTHITGVGQGDGRSNRTGDVITINHIYCGGFFVRTTSEAYVSNAMYRCILFVDKQQIADTVPTMANVLTTPSEVAAPLPNLDFLERFNILWISPIKDGAAMLISHINVLAVSETAATQRLYLEYQWKGNLKVGFNGSAGTDIAKNGVYFGIISNDSGDVIDFDGTARVSFTDV